MSNRTQFESALSCLQPDTGKAEPFPLFWFSDLDSGQVRRLEGVWRKLSVERRRDLMGRMEVEARENFEVDYFSMARMALRDEDDEVRAHAIAALRECEEIRLADDFLPLMTSDPNPSVQAAAAGALGNILYQCEMKEPPSPKGSEIEDALISVFRGKDEIEVRCKALESLGYSSRPEISGLIDRAHQHAEERMRASALIAMGRSADPTWAEDVYAELDSPSPALRKAAAYAAGELSLKQSVRKLVELLDDVDGRVRRQAIQALGEIGGVRAQAALEEIKSKADVEEQALIDEALENAEFEAALDNLEILSFDPDDEDKSEDEHEDEDGDEDENEDENGVTP